MGRGNCGWESASVIEWEEGHSLQVDAQVPQGWESASVIEWEEGPERTRRRYARVPCRPSSEAIDLRLAVRLDFDL
jgi:hypothetical protein